MICLDTITYKSHSGFSSDTGTGNLSLRSKTWKRVPFDGLNSSKQFPSHSVTDSQAVPACPTPLFHGFWRALLFHSGARGVGTGNTRSYTSSRPPDRHRQNDRRRMEKRSRKWRTCFKRSEASLWLQLQLRLRPALVKAEQAKREQGDMPT